ncbi:hypothetical protein CR513_28953, partial [Mucuna pruriens]
MKCMFLEKFFLASKTATIRKEICGIRQHSKETLHEFNKLCATCPHHQINEQLLIQYFYEGLTMMDRNMIDAASGGALMDKTPATARHLISNMASNTQQFGIRGAVQPRMLTKLTSLVRKLAVGQHQPCIVARVCGICNSVEHPTDMCPTLKETELNHPKSVGAIELLRMFRKVEINIPLLDAIKQIPKYAKFLKELCVHKRKKMKGGVEVGGIVSTLTRTKTSLHESNKHCQRNAETPKFSLSHAPLAIVPLPMPCWT